MANKLPTGLSMERLYKGSLDATYEHETLADALDYAKNSPIAYVGQQLYIKDLRTEQEILDNVIPYGGIKYITEDKELADLGSGSVVEGHTHGEYTEDEINALFDGTPEEVSYYESLINDNAVSVNRLFSSQGVMNKITEAILQCNKYTDDMMGSLNHLTAEKADAKPSDADAKELTIYLIPEGTGYHQWMFMQNAWVDLGTTEVNLNGYVTNEKLTEELNKKANDDEVVKIDNVKTSISETPSNDNILSELVTVTELNKKADKMTTLTSANVNDVTSSGSYYVTEATNAPDANGWLEVLSNSNYSVQMFYPSITANCEMYVRRMQDGGAWSSWQKLCSTKVADTDWTNATLSYQDASNTDTPIGSVKYKIKNGICHVTCENIVHGYTGVYIAKISNLPLMVGAVNVTLENRGITVGSVWKSDSTTLGVHKSATDGGFGSFSYPVAEN